MLLGQLVTPNTVAFSQDLKIFNTKDLKLEKTVDIGDDYMKSYILSKDILLVTKNGY